MNTEIESLLSKMATGEVPTHYELGAALLELVKRVEALENKGRPADEPKPDAKKAASMLSLHGIPFSVDTLSQRFVVKGVSGPIEFWPSTGKWRSWLGYEGKGLGTLLEFLGVLGG